MPVLKHAKKKLRQDKKRTDDNLRIKETFKKLIKKAKQNPSAETVSEAFSSIDKATKKHIIHANKAARLKSSLSKAVGSTPAVKEQKATKKVASKKKTSAKKK